MNTPWQDRFPVDAALLPFLMDLETDQVMLVRLSEEDYRNISFLDQRIITPQLPRQLVKWDEISQIPVTKLPRPSYIFHIGHVGSTLISRLLGEHINLLALREPNILRQFSEMQIAENGSGARWNADIFDRRLVEVQNWLSRSFHPDQNVMIKASSFVSPLAETLLKDKGDGLFLFASLERYLQTILAGEASKKEAEALADLRLLRLNRYLENHTIDKAQLSFYQKVGLGWLCEMTTLTKAYDNSQSANIRWMNFDSFLSDPTVELVNAASHFGLDMTPQMADDLINSPIMTRYSKAPEYEYSPSLREELLAEAAQNHSEGIGHTMQWVEKMAKHQPAIARAMEQADMRP